MCSQARSTGGDISVRPAGLKSTRTIRGSDEIYVYPGSFDETGLWQPTYELWTIRRDKWLPAFPSVVSRYEKDRPKWSRTEPE